MTREELAKWYLDQAEILSSSEPLEAIKIGSNVVWNRVDYKPCYEYRIAAGPIKDYPSITQAQIEAWVKDGYTQIAQDSDGTCYVFGPARLSDTAFFNPLLFIGENLYTGSDWRESLRELKS